MARNFKLKESTNYVISATDFSSVNEEAIQSRTLDEKFFPAQETSENSQKIIEGFQANCVKQWISFGCFVSLQCSASTSQITSKKDDRHCTRDSIFLPPTIVCSLNCLRLLPEGLMRYVFPWWWKLSQMAVFCVAMTQDYMDEQIFVIPENFGKFFSGLDKGRHHYQTLESTWNYAVCGMKLDVGGTSFLTFSWNWLWGILWKREDAPWSNLNRNWRLLDSIFYTGV